ENLRGDRAGGGLLCRIRWERAGIHRTLALTALVLFPVLSVAGAAALDRDFSRTIRPLLKQYCLGCHSAEKHKGDLNLEQFSTATRALGQPKVWQAVFEQLALGEMPPKEKPQPSVAERERLSTWVNDLLDEAA